MKKILRGAILIIALTFIQNIESKAQCPMCRTSLESNLNNGGTMGKGINTGILMLFTMPYLLVGGIAYIWLRNKRNKGDEEIEAEISGVS